MNFFIIFQWGRSLQGILNSEVKGKIDTFSYKNYACITTEFHKQQVG